MRVIQTGWKQDQDSGEPLGEPMKPVEDLADDDAVETASILTSSDDDDDVIEDVEIIAIVEPEIAPAKKKASSKKVAKKAPAKKTAKKK